MRWQMVSTLSFKHEKNICHSSADPYMSHRLLLMKLVMSSLRRISGLTRSSEASIIILSSCKINCFFWLLAGLYYECCECRAAESRPWLYKESEPRWTTSESRPTSSADILVLIVWLLMYKLSDFSITRAISSFSICPTIGWPWYILISAAWMHIENSTSVMYCS
mgnify:CR=1 FL=1